MTRSALTTSFLLIFLYFYSCRTKGGLSSPQQWVSVFHLPRPGYHDLPCGREKSRPHLWTLEAVLRSTEAAENWSQRESVPGQTVCGEVWSHLCWLSQQRIYSWGEVNISPSSPLFSFLPSLPSSLLFQSTTINSPTNILNCFFGYFAHKKFNKRQAQSLLIVCKPS